MAEKWDNVGLLIEPTEPVDISTVFLCVDLTESVLEEAIGENANLIISYHPPLFEAMKRLTTADVKQRIALRCIEKRIAVFSPHTSWDVVNNGITDWLARGVSPSALIEPLQPLSPPSPTMSKATIWIKGTKNLEEFTNKLQEKIPVTYEPRTCISSSLSGEWSEQLTFVLPSKNAPVLSEFLREWRGAHGEEELFWEVASWTGLSASQPTPRISDGIDPTIEITHPIQQTQGRIVRLPQPQLLSEIVDNIKKHTELSHIRVACPTAGLQDHKVQTVAVCAGSGASVLKGKKADLYLTGEFGHHDLLSALANKTAVILCEHSNSERGFLKAAVQPMVHRWFEEVKENGRVVVSQKDKDPINIA